MTQPETEADIFTRVLENLRMAEEAAYTLGHLYKFEDDLAHGQGFLAIGEMLKITQINATGLAMGPTRGRA